MQEEFLHYIWQNKKLNVLQLKTTQHEPLEIISGGMINFHSGPDFFNGMLRIGGQLWAGTIEIHIKSSDWFLHNHEQDSAYDNVILHVVYEHDTEIFRRDNSVIPTLELKQYISKGLLDNYKNLFSKKQKWINCEQDFKAVSMFIIDHWLELLYFERLEKKSQAIEHLLEASKNDWEAVLFKLLTKNFGLKVNGEAFFSLANSLDFSVVRKSQSELELLEALFFGQAGLLEEEGHATYYLQLQNEYRFLKQKFQLDNQGVLPMQFFRLRPPNFPTIRLSQLANLYQKEPQLFSKVMTYDKLSDLYALFEVETSAFWNTHFTFKKVSKQQVKKTSKPFIDLLLINTIIPLKFCYAKKNAKDINQTVMDIMNSIASEKNIIIDAFNQLLPISETALQSQALIQLKSEYCDKHKCLKCAIGNTLLNK